MTRKITLNLTDEAWDALLSTQRTLNEWTGVRWNFSKTVSHALLFAAPLIWERLMAPGPGHPDEIGRETDDDRGI